MTKENAPDAEQGIEGNEVQHHLQRRNSVMRLPSTTDSRDPNVFTGAVRLGRQVDRRAIAVTVTESGAIVVTTPGAEPTALTFDEAEHLAALLNDSALIVRVSHGAGIAAVA